MPKGQAPYNKDSNTRDPDDNHSFDAPMTANDGTRLMTRKTSMGSQRVRESSKPPKDQVTPGKWNSKDCIDGKMP